MEDTLQMHLHNSWNYVTLNPMLRADTSLKPEFDMKQHPKLMTNHGYKLDIYRQTSNIIRNLVGNRIVDPWEVMGKDKCKTSRETFKLLDLVLEVQIYRICLVGCSGVIG